MTTEISIYLKNPSFTLQKDEESAAMYTLQFRQKNEFGILEIVNVEFSPADFEVLLNQGRALAPSQKITLTSPQENATWRDAAWPLFRLDDRELQCLIREVNFDMLIQALWFLKSLELARKVVRNMSARSGTMLTEELCQFAGKDPDFVPARESECACGCLREILTSLARLQAEGLIEKFD